MLSTLHLSLVMLGMVVLLAGVWVVSFPPGGNRGIDVGAWGEPEEISMDTESDVEGELNEPYEDEPLPMAGTQVGTRRSFNLDEELSVPRERIMRRRSESPPTIDLPLRTVSPAGEPGAVLAHEEDLQASPTSPTSQKSPHSRRQTDSALLFGRTPSLTSPTTSPRRHRPSQNTSYGTARPTTPPPRQSFPPYGHHPLSPGAPSGFSIGLSPVSPGFALVPRRRRMTSADGLVGTDVARRRIVSEASAGSVPRGASAVSTELRHSVSANEGSQQASGGQEGGSRTGRWKLVSTLLDFTRRGSIN